MQVHSSTNQGFCYKFRPSNCVNYSEYNLLISITVVNIFYNECEPHIISTDMSTVFIKPGFLH